MFFKIQIRYLVCNFWNFLEVLKQYYCSQLKGSYFVLDAVDFWEMDICLHMNMKVAIACWFLWHFWPFFFFFYFLNKKNKLKRLEVNLIPFCGILHLFGWWLGMENIPSGQCCSLAFVREAVYLVFVMSFCPLHAVWILWITSDLTEGWKLNEFSEGGFFVLFF